MNRVKKYRLSFTAASLRLAEISELATQYLNGQKDSITKDTIIRGRNTRTTDREYRELRLRIETLTEKQLTLLAKGDLLDQKHIALLSVCKLYSFIRDFVVEILREKAVVFDFQMTEGEYGSFIRRKSEIHSELEELAESSTKKIKQVTFKILEQSGLIDNVVTKRISPQLLSDKVFNAIVEEDPEWLKIYLLTDSEIVNRMR